MKDHDADARDWITSNAAAWRYMCSQALAMARGGQRFGMDLLCSHLRWKGKMRIARGKAGWRVDNNHRATFARVLCETYPHLADCIDTRRSAADKATA